MANGRVLGARLLAQFAAIVVVATAAHAQTYERPPSFNAAQIAGIKRVGENYTIQNPVKSDGILRIYQLTTPYGEFTVQGDEMMRMRSNELHALALLEKVSNSESFGQAVAKAGLSPLVFTGHLITNPVGTVQNTFAGVGNFFGRLSSGMANAGKTQDDAMSSLLGVSDERRELAATYGVDPYTDFPPLAAKLDQLSRAAAAGGLVVKGALFAIPGAAGIVVSNLATANTVNNLGLQEIARSYTASQILDLNRAALEKMGIESALAESFLSNRNYTPIDATALVAALNTLNGVQHRELFIARAASADGRAIAYVLRRTAELYADDYRKHGGYVRFASLADFPYVVTRDGRVTALLPIDAFAWTRETAGGFNAVTAARKGLAPGDRGELRITGMATALAKKEMQQRNWAVRDHQRP
ncbi:MAG TPA: hypothetical protein VFA57_07870 [Pseudolabrys sp.]|nr:hypothetical protein [Pseudolabrys sp.]